MKKFNLYCTFTLLITLNSCFHSSKEEEKIVPVEIDFSVLKFLSSDNLKGRSYMRPEINIAANYIIEKFRLIGLKEVSGISDYSQTFEIYNIQAKNIIGWVEGSDKKLKDQFIVLSAHYDHLGVVPEHARELGQKDSIFNGARDNAVGVEALIDAAKYFVKHPPKRSIMFIAFTGEEALFLGSRYFINNPVVPLEQLVFNLNIDNADYNDTSVVTILGSGRTTVDKNIKSACIAQ